ncbi:hypothetical protein GGI35DRAFT_21346 [Trichoderma velutinum]
MLARRMITGPWLSDLAILLRFPARTSHTTGDQGRGRVSGRLETCSTMSLSVNKDLLVPTLGRKMRQAWSALLARKNLSGGVRGALSTLPLGRVSLHVGQKNAL